MAGLEAARLLLAKARQDEYVLEQFAGNPQAADETFGFHAQQAAEKLLKAALVARGGAYPRTHRLGDLLDLARDRGLALPLEFDGLHDHSETPREGTRPTRIRALSRPCRPAAFSGRRFCKSLYRYEFFAEEVDQPLDRPAVREEVRRLRAWVELFLKQCETSEHG